MTAKDFVDGVTHDRGNILDQFLAVLEHAGTNYCVIGGLAVNAYVEPLVSLDLDVVVAMESLESICSASEAAGFQIERFEHSVNLYAEGSDVRIQLQTDHRYQEFLLESERRDVLGRAMRVAKLEHVFKGKLWAYQDSNRRRSKRQKDLLDITRLVEAFPKLMEVLPSNVRELLGE